MPRLPREPTGAIKEVKSRKRAKGETMTKASEILNAIINGSLNGDLSISALKSIENVALRELHEKGAKSYSEEQCASLSEKNRASDQK